MTYSFLLSGYSWVIVTSRAGFCNKGVVNTSGREGRCRMTGIAIISARHMIGALTNGNRPVMATGA